LPRNIAAVERLLTCIKSREVNGLDEKEKHVWRLHQPSESRKLHLFPSKNKLSAGLTGRKSPDTAIQLSKALENGTGDKELAILGITQRSKSKDLKLKEQAIIRRRKVPVPELGTMTTVQEVAMDSRK
jgi:hypothetical protein